MDRKHIPMRTCVGCGVKVGNKDLTRIVFVPENGVVVDSTGRKPGRGTYLCPRLSCWETGVRKGRIAHTLGHMITPSETTALLAYAYEHYEVPATAQEQDG